VTAGCQPHTFWSAGAVLMAVRHESLSPWYVTASRTDRVCLRRGGKLLSFGHLSLPVQCIGQRSCRGRCFARWVVIGHVLY